MDTRTAEFLVSKAGGKFLSQAAGETDPLKRITALRKSLDADMASAVSAQVDLRTRARERFSRAGEMLFTSLGLEQATSESVWNYRASVFDKFEAVADLTCGIGADALALARKCRVLASDSDPAKVIIAGHNAGVYGVSENVDFKTAEASAYEGNADALFLDPDRRSETCRATEIGDYRPPWNEIRTILEKIPSALVKCSPLLSWESFEPGLDWSFDVVEARGEVKELALRFGGLALDTRRAVMADTGETLEESNTEIEVKPSAGKYIYDPAPSAVRAHLLGELAEILQGWKTDLASEYIGSPVLVHTPFASAFEVKDVLPLDIRRLKKYLSERGVGVLEIKVRGVKISPEKLRAELGLKGSQAATVLLTTLDEGVRAIVAERIPCSE